MNKHYLRLGTSLLIALSASFFIFRGAQGVNKVEYRHAVVVKEIIHQNEEISPASLLTKKAPVDSIPRGALNEFPTGKIAAYNIYPGQYLIPQMLADHKTVVEKPEHRIYPVPVSLSSAGKIMKGDMVDVYWFFGGENSAARSEQILTGVLINRVLNSAGNEIDKKMLEDNKIGEKATPAVVELLVTAEQANKLNLAVNTGLLSLAKYKPGSESVNVPVISQNSMGGLIGETKPSSD